MKYNIGDKVKFLNTSGGGIITKIISSTMVNVAIEEGFEIPTMTSELLKIDYKGKCEKVKEKNTDDDGSDAAKPVEVKVAPTISPLK